MEVFAGPEQDYLVTVEQLEAAVTDRTKILLFVSPSNPTGAVYSPEQVAEIGQWAAAKGLWVVTDEIYEHLTYDGVPFTSIATAVPELGDKVVILNGVAKTYAMTGWRVGWMIGPADVIKAATNLQSHATSNVSNIPQVAALAAVSGPLTAVDEMKVAFDRRRKAIVAGLNAIEGVECPTPKGAFYVYADVRALLGKEFPTANGPVRPGDLGRTGRADPGRGGGRRGSGRGFRPVRLPAAVLRPGRRGPRHRRRPPAGLPGQGEVSLQRSDALSLQIKCLKLPALRTDAKVIAPAFGARGGGARRPSGSARAGWRAGACAAPPRRGFPRS